MIRVSNPDEARFYALVQTDREAHEASSTMDTRSLQEAKRPCRGTHNLTLSSAEVVNGLEL
jgi:hypothetical protein